MLGGEKKRNHAIKKEEDDHIECFMAIPRETPSPKTHNPLVGTCAHFVLDL